MPNLNNKFQYGDIILFRPTDGLTSRLISKIDGSEYSHVGIFWKYDKGVPLFFESHEARGGVVINKLQEWGNFDVVRTKILEPRPEADMIEMVGRRYDYSMIWWILKTKIFKKRLQNNDNMKVICSEYGDFCYRYALGGGYVCTPKTISDLKKRCIFHKVY